MQDLAGPSQAGVGIYGGIGGDGEGGSGQGGGGGAGQGPTTNFGGMQLVFQSHSSHGANQQTGPAGQSQIERANSQLSASVWDLHIPDPTTASLQITESQSYCSQMLRQGRGFPLYDPDPQSSLPRKYRKHGVAIGDIGAITSEGAFDFLFNIYLRADDPKKVPRDFDPLPLYDPVDISHHAFHPGNCVSTSSVREESGDFTEFPGGEFVFNCTGPEGAVLALPHGAHREKLKNLKDVRDYAARHAESWYEYANVTRGRELVNGSLYLVTGWEKAESWGMASFHDGSLEFKLSFKPTKHAPIYKYRWNRDHCHRKQADSKGTPLNQTTFIHAFAISVCEGIWGKLFGIKVCQPVDSSTLAALSGRSFVPYASQGSSMLKSLFFGSSGHSGGRQCTGAAPPSIGLVTDAFPIPKIIHPSQIIHEHILREVPQARVVITHDDDWRDVFKEDGLRTYSELQQAIFGRSKLMQENGVVFLKPKSHPNDVPIATAQEHHGLITACDFYAGADEVDEDEDNGDSGVIVDPQRRTPQPHVNGVARWRRGRALFRLPQLLTRPPLILEEMVPPVRPQLDNHKKAWDKLTNPVEIELERAKKRAREADQAFNTVERRGPVCSMCFSRCQISRNPWQCTFDDRAKIDDATPRKPVTHGTQLASCKHYFCGTCLAQAIYLHLNLEFDREKYGTVLGPQNIATPGLHAQWPIYCPTCTIKPGKKRVPISDVTAQQTLGEPNMEEWKHAQVLFDLITCPHKHCGKTFTPDEGAKTLIQCLWCGGSLCKACRSIWHESMTCERYQALPIEQRAPEDAVFLNLAKQEKWRRCPKCSTMVELKYGCNHITCVCGDHFCYICGAPFEYENGVYRCTGGENCTVWEEQQYMDY